MTNNSQCLTIDKSLMDSLMIFVLSATGGVAQSNVLYWKRAPHHHYCHHHRLLCCFFSAAQARMAFRGNTWGPSRTAWSCCEKATRTMSSSSPCRQRLEASRACTGMWSRIRWISGPCSRRSTPSTGAFFFFVASCWGLSVSTVCCLFWDPWVIGCFS